MVSATGETPHVISYLFPSSRPDRLLPPDFFSGAAFISVFLLVFSGCHYYEEYRVLKSTADLQDEKAALSGQASRGSTQGKRTVRALHAESP